MIPAEQTPETLGARLRRERERRQIALSSISANTKISASLFDALERGDVSRWPAGIYRRSWVRAYAQAIGLDPDTVAREFAEQFPDPLDTPLPLEPPAPLPSAAALVAATPVPVTPPPAPADAKVAVRLKLADVPTTFAPGRLLAGIRPRLIAIACDGGIVAVIALCAFVVCGRFWLPLGIAMLAYYLGGILLLGNAPGVCLCAPGADGQTHYNRTPDDAHSPWRVGVPAR